MRIDFGGKFYRKFTIMDVGIYLFKHARHVGEHICIILYNIVFVRDKNKCGKNISVLK